MAILTISAELAARIEANAKARGQSVEDLLTDLIAHQPPSENRPQVTTQQAGNKIDPAMFGFINDIGVTDLSGQTHEVLTGIFAGKHERPD